MDVRDIDEVRKTFPFVPFRLVMSDGGELKVSHPDFIWRVPDQTIFYVATRGGMTQRIAASHVTRIIIQTDSEEASEPDITLKDA